MEKKEAAAKAREDLEKLYLGIPEGSLELTFQYLAKNDEQNEIVSSEPISSLPVKEGRDQMHKEVLIERLGMASSSSKGREENEFKGISHSNTCAFCSSHIRLFRHRCLVCGRVYCKKCVEMGMGEMTEGRKCIQCLGRRFSQRYIKKAGNSGCCFGYPSEVKQQELIWAEKGPSRSYDARTKSSLVPSSISPRNGQNFIVTRSPRFS